MDMNKAQYVEDLLREEQGWHNELCLLIQEAQGLLSGLDAADAVLEILDTIRKAHWRDTVMPLQQEYQTAHTVLYPEYNNIFIDNHEDIVEEAVVEEAV